MSHGGRGWCSQTPPLPLVLASGLSLHSLTRAGSPSGTFSATGSGVWALLPPLGTEQTRRSRLLPAPASRSLPPSTEPFKGICRLYSLPQATPSRRERPLLVRGRPLQGRGPLCSGTAGPLRADGPARGWDPFQPRGVVTFTLGATLLPPAGTCGLPASPSSPALVRVLLPQLGCAQGTGGQNPARRKRWIASGVGRETWPLPQPLPTSHRTLENSAPSDPANVN